MECRRTSRKLVLTIFYDVDPSHVRKQTGKFGMAYRQTCETKTEEQKLIWKQALTDVAEILGEHSYNWHSEADMVSKIAKDVAQALNFTPSRDFDDLVGMEAHIQNADSLLCLDSDKSSMVGIWGPAGIGKTTIARAIYNRISRTFNRSLFMEDVKTLYTSGDHSGSGTYALMKRLQKEFLSRILDDKDMEIEHLDTAKEWLHSEKVLVVLDNVDKIEQLRALAIHPRWFGEGSRIIVTTEDKRLLKAHKIEHVYEVGFPSNAEAVEIFSQAAFTQKVPPEGYEVLATEVVQLTSHLPLGLCVLGNALSGESVGDDSLIWEGVSEWTGEILARLRSSLDGDIKQVLIVAYNGLNDKDKAIFLHIACLLEGVTISYLMQCLGNSGLEIKIGLQVLAGRALISILSDRSIRMHNLLRQMGREIVCGHCIRLSRKCWFFIGARNIYAVVSDITGTGTAVDFFFGTSQVNFASGESPSGISRLHRNLMDMGRKLETLLNGIRGSVFLRLSLLIVSMIWLLNRYTAFLSLVSMSPPALANFRFGYTRRSCSY